MTPEELLVACAEGRLDLVEQGLAEGLSPYGQAHDAAPLYEAVEGGHLAVVERLLGTGMAVDHRLGQGMSILERGFRAGVPMLQKLLDAGATLTPEQQEPVCSGLLPSAAYQNDPDLLRWLLARGAPLDSRDQARTGRHALHIAGWLGHDAIVPCLVQAGLDVNGPDAAGMTPLHWATRGSHDRTVAALLRAGADVFATDQNGVRPYDLAQEGVLPTVTELINARARVPMEHAALHATLAEVDGEDRGRRRL